MSEKIKELSNPFSTGGGGVNFESKVQAAFVVLMLTNGLCPALPSTKILKIKLQGKFAGYNTDDVIVFVEDTKSGINRKLLGQIKHSISITETNPTFCEVIKAAWSDYNNKDLFDKSKDKIALITGPLSSTDINDVRAILEWARHTESAEEFLQNVNLAKFSSNGKRAKLTAFKENLKKANSGAYVGDDELLGFLKCFHLLGYDLDIQSGVTLSLLHSHIGQFAPDEVNAVWAQLVLHVQEVNKNAGTISLDSIPEEIRDYFKELRVSHIPKGYLKTEMASKLSLSSTGSGSVTTSLMIANMLGSWNESNKADADIIRRLLDGI